MQVVEALERGASYDTFVCASGYLLGEYGTLLPDVAPTQQFKLLHDRFVAASPDTKVGADRLAVEPAQMIKVGGIWSTLSTGS